MLEKFGVRVTPFLGAGGGETKGKVLGSNAIELQLQKNKNKQDSQSLHPAAGSSSAGKKEKPSNFHNNFLRHQLGGTHSGRQTK